MTRFWAKVTRGAPHECWEWQATLEWNGYGRFQCGHRKRGAAHRFIYQVTNGPIPEGLVVRHKCDNRKCVNPGHLEVGTFQDNINDRVVRGRNGDNSGMAIGGNKLSVNDVRAIRANPDGLLQRELGERYGITQNMVSKIQLRRSWSNLP